MTVVLDILKSDAEELEHAERQASVRRPFVHRHALFWKSLAANGREDGKELQFLDRLEVLCGHEAGGWDDTSRH